MTKIPSTDTTTTALLVQLWNDSIRTMCNIRGGKLRFLETVNTVATVADQQAYQVPARVRKVIDLYITVGNNIYLPTPIYNPEQWNLILASRLGTSDVPLFYYVQDTQILIAPTPATSSNTITIRGRLNTRDLSIADYTTGTIVSVANGGTAVVGSGTTWTASMAGRYIKITDSDTANKGDGFWYEIASVGSATTLTLVAPYEGTSIAAGAAAYKIGQMTPLPDAYDMGPIYRALALFYQINDPLHPAFFNQYWKLYDGGQEAGLSNLPGGLVAQMLENEGETTEGAYISPNRVRMVDPNYPPQNLTGFN